MKVVCPFKIRLCNNALWQKLLHFRRWTLVACWLVILTMLYSNFEYSFWKDKGRVIMGDVVPYYQYLPALFVHHDISMQFTRVNADKHKDHFWLQLLGNGGLASRMTIGMSVLYTPFFLAAHALAEPLGYPADGYTMPYKFALVISCMFYTFFGFWFLRKALLAYFSDTESAVTILAIGLATNLFFYTVIEPPMSHAYSFSLVALLIWLVIRWYQAPTFLRSLLIGMVAGMILLVRPSNLVLLLLIFLWGIGGLSDLRNRMGFLMASWKKITVMALAALLVISPQLVYWWDTTGQVIFYSYGEERFFFDHPHILQGIFGYRNGWLIYTPVMVFALAGMIIAARKYTRLIIPIVFVWLITIYLVFSWWCWWYASSFGLRAMIDSYGLLAFPFTAFTAWMFRKKIIVRTAYLIIICFFIFLNIFQTHQYYTGSIHWGSMTKEAYWDSFLREWPSERFHSLLRHPDYQLAKKGIISYKEVDVVKSPDIQSADNKEMDAFIRHATEFIRNDTGWYRQITEKAARLGRPVDSVLYEDAVWLWQQKKEKGPTSSP